MFLNSFTYLDQLHCFTGTEDEIGADQMNDSTPNASVAAMKTDSPIVGLQCLTGRRPGRIHSKMYFFAGLATDLSPLPSRPSVRPCVVRSSGVGGLMDRPKPQR